MNFTVKIITNEFERKEVFAIRKEVFVVEQNVPENEEYDEYEDSSIHFLCYAEGLPCGTARLRKTESGVKLERFAVVRTFRKIGVGNTLLRFMLHSLREKYDNQIMIYLHAQLQALAFYEKNHFKRVGELFYECDIPHYKMIYQYPSEQR
jgi:predicted GNAT family N-acyltransferase